MRKVALLTAVLVAAAFSSTSNVAVAQGQDLNPSTTKFLQDAVNPYAATAKPAAPAMKAHKKMKKAKK
jgi:predicted small secreted protein